MASVNSLLGRVAACWLGGLILFGFATVANAQVNADVEFSSMSPTDPHPTSYVWSGKNEPILDPGTEYFTFYYTGTINPDARVPQDILIERVAIPLSEWEANHKWVVNKLRLYYQLTKNLSPTALQDLSGEAQPEANASGTAADGAAANGAEPIADANAVDANGQPIAPGAEVNPATGQTPATPGMMPGAPGMMPGMPGGGMPGMMPGMPGMMPGMPGMMPGMPGGMPGMPGAAGMGGFNGPSFDPVAAAEWTFYYDQLVLWQYYCARQLLNNMEDELLETTSTTSMSGPAANNTSNRRGIAGMLGNKSRQKTLTPVELASSVQPGESGRGILGQLKQRQSARPGGLGINSTGTMGGMPGMMGGMGGGMPGMMGGGMGGMGGMMGGGMMGGGMSGMAAGGTNGEDGPVLREVFSPMEDYSNPDHYLVFREKFQRAAQNHEQDIYKNFIDMINRIDQREMNQERYDQWLEARRKELSGFADSWQKVDQGDTFMVKENLYMVTKEPLDSVPVNGVNVIKRERLTPQDILDGNGKLTQPKAE